MKLLRMVGVLVAAAGGIWILQGLRLVPADSFLSRSFMMGRQEWIWYGAIAVVVGLGLIFLGARRKRA